MPSYQSHSPSLQKMEGQGRPPRRQFSFGRIWGDPFALSTISIAILAWFIAFIACIIGKINDPNFSNYIWWAVVFYFCCIIGVIVMVASDQVFTYHVAAVGFLSNGLFLTTSAVNSLIYSSRGAEEAAAAGFILLSIVAIIWIFYYGSQPQAGHRQFIDSFALHKSPGPASLRSPRAMSNNRFSHQNPAYANNPPQTFSHNHLRGLETSSPVTNNHASNFLDHRNSQPRFGGPVNQQYNTNSQLMDGTSNAGDDVAPPTEYPYKARAIYSYEANPDDANEISFQKHEILEVSDVSGRWWQAKKMSGETGIAPSNYLILL